MTGSSYKRIRRELAELEKAASSDPSVDIKIEPIDDKLLSLKGEIVGPSDTPYAGGKFHLQINVPGNYPFDPPRVKFITRVWHPNISSVTGAICLDILKDQWAAAMTLRTTLLSIQALLASPFPEDPQDAVVAKQYQSNMEMFKATAEHWTALFAQGPFPNKDFATKISFMIDSGIDKTDAINCLSMNNWNLELALNDVIGNKPSLTSASTET